MANSSLSGQRLGAYDVGALLGVGGMGEVYRARDSKLNRDVAIKVLLPAVASDAERLARFRREAQTLAALNHPGIAQIHGLDDGSGGPFLVMELVDGPTLADRIAAGRLPVDEAIAIARQIVDALETAHERGIIHRDLKPANIKVRDDGTVKVLDFGLAKAIEPVAADPNALPNSPTITSPAMTQAGLILGTAAYMSPEQAKGRAVDKRSDIWAFGCVLYEMLTGTRAFDGEDVTETIAAVVRGEPDWNALPPDLPSQIRLLLKRCLEKDRRARIGDVSVARFLMTETIDSGRAPAGAEVAPPRRSKLAFAAAAAAGLLAGAALVATGAWMLTPVETVRPPVRFTITPPQPRPLLPQGNDHDLAIASDGSFVVYRSGDAPSMQSRLMLRELDQTEARELPGTSNARFPFLSPDRRWVGFFVGNELRKVSIAGGAPSAVARIPNAPRGASWGDDDFIVLTTADAEGLYRVAATGGEARLLVASDRSTREMIAYPHVLPGSKTVLLTTYPQDNHMAVRVDAVDVASGVRKTVLEGAADPSYVDPGYLVFATGNTSTEVRYKASLRAVRFDAASVQVQGDPVTVVDAVMAGVTNGANYTVSRRGDLAFIPGGTSAAADASRTLVWVDRQGREEPIKAQPRAYAVARLSPDGTRIALDARDQTGDIWVWDLARETLTPLDRHAAQDMSPVWSPSGKEIVWSSTRAGGNPNLYRRAADGSGTPERLTTNSGNQFPTAMTADGNSILLFGSGSGSMDIYRVNLNEPERKQAPLIASPAFDFGAELSPDGKWLSYHSNESGEPQVYVRPFPAVDGGRWQISQTGGSRSVWSRSGNELFYLDRDGYLTSVAVKAVGGQFSAGAPTTLLKTVYYRGFSVLGLDLRAYDVSLDGKRFIMIKDPDGGRREPQMATMMVTLNFDQELRSRLPIP